MPTRSTTGVCPYPDLSPEFKPFDLAEPWDFYERARNEAPIFYSRELGYWVVSRYEDMREIFRTPEVFSSENTQSPYRQRPAPVQKILDDGGFSVFSGLSARQPPDHTRLRGFIKKAFTPRRIAAQEPRIRAIATTMIDAFVDRGQADLVDELAYELPALVILGMLGIPESDVQNVKQWAASRVYLNFGDAPVAEQVHHAENLVRYWRYCQDLVAARLQHPEDDLPGDLARIYLEGDQTLTVDEIAGLVYGQLTAGHETTTSLLAGGILELLRQRQVWEQLCADPELIPGAVEEMLRLSAPVFAWKRRTKTAATIAGVEIPPESNVLILLGSANRDPAQFPDPTRIDVDRDNASRHLSFGLGIHFCLGAPLARLEARIVLEELTPRLPGMQLVDGQRFEYTPNSTFRCPSQVLVEWDPDPDPGPEPESTADSGAAGRARPSAGDHTAVWRRALPHMRARKNDVHIPLAYDYAQRLLAEHPEADAEVVLLAILLHDIGWAVVDQEAIYAERFGPGMMESELRFAHEREGARLAREILADLDYERGLIDRVAEIIDGHDTRSRALSREDELVKDADALWRFSVAGIGVACGWFGLTPGQYADRVEPQIEARLFTDAARAIARSELAESRRLLRTLELDGGPDS